MVTSSGAFIQTTFLKPCSARINCGITIVDLVDSFQNMIIYSSFI